MLTINPTIKFEGWQVTRINKIWEIYLEGIIRGVILADVISLGKIYQIFGFWLMVSSSWISLFQTYC